MKAFLSPYPWFIIGQVAPGRKDFLDALSGPLKKMPSLCDSNGGYGGYAGAGGRRR
jgi:hypothetical protein